MKLVHDGRAIECNAALIISRKIVPSSYMQIVSIGNCKTFKCKRNSEATIVAELNPKTAIHNINSSLNLDDKLECEDMFLAINHRRTPRITLTKHSGRHNAQTFSTDNYTYAEISRQIPSTPQLIPRLTFTPVHQIQNPEVK